jgi:tetratricopeptide (TPR) repeat protein
MMFRRRPSPLADFLTRSKAPIGTLSVEGWPLADLIAAETDTAVLDAAATRAAATGDMRWRMAIAQRRLHLGYDATRAAELAIWQLDNGHPDAASATLASATGKTGASEPFRNALARVALAKGNRRVAQDWLSTPDLPVQRWVQAGWSLLSAGHWDAARHVLDDPAPDIASNPAAEILRLRARAVFDSPEAALEQLSDRNDLFRPGSVIETDLRVQFLLDLGRFAEALDVVLPVIDAHPDAWGLYGLAEGASAQSDQSDKLQPRVDRALALYPTHPHAVLRAANLAIDLAHMDQAKSLLARLRHLSDWDWQAARFGLLTLTAPRADIETAYATAIASGLPKGRVAPMLASYYYYYKAADGGLERARTLADPMLREAAHDPGTQCLSLRLMLADGDETGALQHHAALPDGLRGMAALAPFGLLAQARSGDDAGAAMGWQRHLARSAHIATNARSAHPEQITMKWDGAADDVLVFLTVFNGIEFVDWFLDHYRSLGVGHFFVVDNGSTDGSFEALTDQPDVSLFRQTDSFRAAGCGVSWMNHLIRRFGVGHWCFLVDMDEAFVFPHMEQGRSLNDFLQFADDRGWRSIPAPMIDIYPDSLAGPSKTGTPFEASRNIDADYVSFANEAPPYEFVQGGVRARLSGRSLMMTKAPLVKPGPSFAFTANNHQHTHLPVARFSGTLLHFKFIGDIMGRVDEAIERKEHFMAARFYRALRQPLDRAEDGYSLLSEHSRRYETPADLLRLGLMRSVPDWDLWDGGHD